MNAIPFTFKSSATGGTANKKKKHQVKDSYNTVPYFTVDIVLWLNASLMEAVDMTKPWNQEGKLLQSERHFVIVIENGWKVRYDVQLRPRHNVRNTPGGLKSIEAHARSLVGARAINFYDPKRKRGTNFCYRQNLSPTF